MLSTLSDLFYRAIDRNSPRLVQYRRTIDDTWAAMSSAEFYRSVLGVCRALNDWGIRKGDRVAILSENRPEWAVADFATLLLGLPNVPIYLTLPPAQTAYILKDCGAKVLFVSTQGQLNKCLEALAETEIDRVILMDTVVNEEVDRPNVIQMSELMQRGPSRRDRDFDLRAKQISPEDLATIIYTSGTTGAPKGVKLSHANLAINASASLKRVGWLPGQVSISFLPLSHITARHVDYCCFLAGIVISYCPSMEELPKAIKELRPGVFVAVPRIYEKMRFDLETWAATGLKRRLLSWAKKVGRQNHESIVAGKKNNGWRWKLADQLVLHRLRDSFGGAVQLFHSGGAPLGMELSEWYINCGIRILEGYGLTETSPVIAVNSSSAFRVGSVGRPLENVDCKIAEDGEILVRGVTVFKEYWRLPEATRETFEDGWFKTGDIGRLDDEGFLFVTDRKKDLIKTSGGKFVAPQPLEAALKTKPLISQAVVIGDKRRFVSVLIVPNFLLLDAWARNRSLKFAGRKEQVRHPDVQRLYSGIVDDLNRNLAKFETLKKILLLPKEFSVDGGELTGSMKVRRNIVEQNYKNEIDALYEDHSA